MSQIPYIAIDRQECHTPERAELMLQQMLADDKRNLEGGPYHDPMPFSDVHSRKVSGSCVVSIRFSYTDLGDVARAFKYEGKHREAMHLMQGRKILPAHNGGEEPNGMLSDLY
jgi:hypothetical protein